MNVNNIQGKTEPRSFVGRWVSSLPFDSDDYLVEYNIVLEDEELKITALDLQDGEEMRICDVSFAEGILSFDSLMPSTGRRGRNLFRLKGDGVLEAEFTFTVVEELKRIEPGSGGSR